MKRPLVVLPSNAIMRDQISKLNERGLTSFVVQGRSVQVDVPVVENIGQVSHAMEALKEPHCRILFIHPEVCLDDSNFISLLKSPMYQKRVKCPSDQGMVSQFLSVVSLRLKN